MTGPPHPIVRVGVEELRQLFNVGRFWERVLAGELRASLKREGHPAPAASGQPYCTRSQEVFYFDPDGMESPVFINI